MRIVFENCEVAEVSLDNITYMNLWGVTDSISYSRYQKRTDVFKHAEGFNVGIRASCPLRDRCLQYKDITQIVWEGETYFMNWKDYDIDENEYQTVHIGEDDGVIHINISEVQESAMDELTELSQELGLYDEKSQ